jgi:hypothetical protein
MATLKRTTFRTLRTMDFFSEKELVTQTGHGRKEWPPVFLKETIDNALDACEEAGIAPQINVKVDAGGMTVTDNGPGIPVETIAGAMDFTVRCSNREMYVAPDRGAQGNALMTLLSMPYVVDPAGGKLVIRAHGVSHDIVCGVNPLTQCPEIHNDTSDAEGDGTTVGIYWTPRVATEHEYDEDGNETGEKKIISWPFKCGCPVAKKRPSYEGKPIRARAFDLFHGYAIFNPHLHLTVDWFGDVTVFEPTNTAWKKWTPSTPTSPHWYELRHLERLIGAYVAMDQAHGRDRTVADFVGEFDGLSGSAKKKTVLEATGLARVNLSSLVSGEGLSAKLDDRAISTLLAAMKAHTKEVKPKRLGLIGKAHLLQRLTELGCVPEKSEYRKVTQVDDGVCSVFETAFGYRGDDQLDRLLYVGANWSAAIANPFRSFGSGAEGLEGQLRQQYAGSEEPIVFIAHLAHPRIEFADRGKTAIVLDDDED